MTATIHRMADVKNDVDALSWSAQLIGYLMTTYEIITRQPGKFIKPVTVLTKGSGFLDATGIITKIIYFGTDEVRKDRHRIFRIIGKGFMTVADACGAASWLIMVGVLKLGRFAAKIGVLGTVTAIGGFMFYGGDAIQRLVKYSGKAGAGVQVADASISLVAAVAELASAVFCLVTGQIVLLLALGILAKTLSLTSFIFGQVNDPKLKATA